MTTSLQSYELGRVLGEGAYGHVIFAKQKDNGQQVSIKIITKNNLIKAKKTQSPITEKEALSRLSNQNIVSLITTFQDNLCLYFVFEFIPNGLLSHFLSNSDPQVNVVRHIFGQVLLAISAVHQKGIIHRDIKPENVMLDDQNRAKLIDFGSAKLFDIVQTKKEGFVRGSFVGSVDYISPEILGDRPTTPSVDLWAFGCMLFFAFEKRAPFFAETKMKTYENIESCQFTLTEKTPENAADLIKKLLVLEYDKRIGYGEQDNNYESIRSHPFFDNIDWKSLPTEPPPI